MLDVEGVALEVPAEPTVLTALAEPPSLPIPALATTDDATLLASFTSALPSPEGQLERTDESLDELDERLPELTRELGTQERPKAELQADLSALVTANT